MQLIWFKHTRRQVCCQGRYTATIRRNDRTASWELRVYWKDILMHRTDHKTEDQAKRKAREAIENLAANTVFET